MMPETEIRKLMEAHIASAKANGSCVSVYNYHLGAAEALKAVLNGGN